MSIGNKKTVHYLTYYIEQEYAEFLDGSMAVVPKVEYICDSLKPENINIQLISTASAKSGMGWFSIKRKQVSNQENHLYFSSYGAKSKIGRFISRIWIKVQLLFYLFKNVKKEDSVLIYHSLQYIWIIFLFRLFKKNKVIFQVEEIYSDAYKKFRNFKKREKKYLLKGNGFICINEMVQEAIAKGKPSIVLYGDYRLPSQVPKKGNKPQKIHVVYAGVIEPTRNAAVTAVNAARFLNENYIIHIAGFGRSEDIKKLNELICEVNSNLNYVGVQYDGSFRGEEFKKYLQEKDIGLNCHSYTQEDLISAEVTFPSKIIIYLNNGLKVVSPKINCLVNCNLSELIHFYEGFDAKNLAGAILMASNMEHDKDMIFSKITLLDKNFKNDLKNIL